MKQNQLLAVAILSGFWASFSLHGQSSATTNTPAEAPDKAADYLFKWNLATLVNAYEHGP
jgi:hypothetical protein